MGSCYSSQGSREVTLDSVDFPSSITTASSPSLFKMLLCSGNWNKKNKNKNKKKKKKRGILDLDENRSFGGSAEERELHRIPGRMFVSGGSDVACLFTQQGRKGINQDAMLVWENFSSENDTIFCGVFDGHGPYGHMVAKRVRDSLPLKLCSQWKANSSNDRKSNVVVTLDSEETASFSMDDEWCESLDDENVKLPQMYLPLKQSLLKAFKLMDKELKLHPTIDCFCSGTTAVTMVKRGQDLVIANVGDSRAVLGTRDKDNCLIAVQLTVDLKPNLPREAARIHRCKGRVFALPDEPEVPRVWLPNNDSPGLAMARAFGDFCLKDFGLISVPDVYYHHLTGRDEFIVLATDGVWDVLSNKEVIDIVASAPSNATAARALVDCAVRAWRLKFPTSKSDDCAVVCLFLEHPSAVNQVQEEENALEGRREELVEPTISTWKEREKTDGNEQGSYLVGDLAHSPVFLQNSCALLSSDEIVPVSESMEEKRPERCQSTRSLAECISTAEDEEWSALEGVTRVNSLLNIPRFLSGDKKAATWRKWL